MESKILGTQQRFYTVVSPNLRNICSFLKVNLYTVYISRRVRFHSSISFLCVCVCVIYCNRNLSFSSWCCLSPWNKTGSFSSRVMCKWKWFHKCQHVIFPSLCKTGSTPSNAKNQIPLETREGIFLVLGSCRTSRAHQPIDYPFSLLCFLS